MGRQADVIRQNRCRKSADLAPHPDFDEVLDPHNVVHNTSSRITGAD